MNLHPSPTHFLTLKNNCILYKTDSNVHALFLQRQANEPTLPTRLLIGRIMYCILLWSASVTTDNSVQYILTWNVRNVEIYMDSTRQVIIRRWMEKQWVRTHCTTFTVIRFIATWTKHTYRYKVWSDCVTASLRDQEVNVYSPMKSTDWSTTFFIRIFRTTLLYEWTYIL